MSTLDKIETIQAINPKYQSIINRFIRWDRKYQHIVDTTDDNGGLAQERAYNKAYELFNDLPKREQKNLSKHFPTIGY